MRTRGFRWMASIFVLSLWCFSQAGFTADADGTASRSGVPTSAIALSPGTNCEIQQPGASFEMSSGEAVLRQFETLPRVENDYTRRFRFDRFDNPKLKELRTRYKLDAVIAPGLDEFDQQVRLMDWTHRQFKKFGRPSTQPRGALDILKGIDNGETFFCSHYANLFVSAAASLGWIDRELALRRHQGSAVGGSTEHSTTEIWSNQFAKWVMLDPTCNMYLEKDGKPLNAFEIRQEWFYAGGNELVFVVGKERNRYRKADLPILLARFADFGDLAINPDELDKYGFIGYIPNTNLMDSGEDYAKMFIVKDALCEGTQWHTRTTPANPAVDPYFPIGQATIALRPDEKDVAVRLETLTPNFESFEVRLDEQQWTQSGKSFTWTLHRGQNRIQARTVNQFGVRGPESLAVIDVSRPW